MKHQQVINDLRDELSLFVTKVEGSGAMGLYDLAQISEGLMCALLTHLLALPGLRNLNAEEKKNFPGIDLADDRKRVAIQVTQTASLDKIKQTLETFLKHGLEARYDRLVVYILAKRQDTYSQSATDKVCSGRFEFKTKRDVMDYRDLLECAIHVGPHKARAALDVIRAYHRGTPHGLAPEDYDPPQGNENVTLNLVELYMPAKLYVAELLPEVKPGKTKARNFVREQIKSKLSWAPTDFELNARRVITFSDVTQSDGPFASVIDLGTAEPYTVDEFCGIDDDHERIFKSLVRLCVQAKLWRSRIKWDHEDSLFIFLPLLDGHLEREESWVTGNRTSQRHVFWRKLNKNDPEKTFVCKHLAFGIDFIKIADQWYAAITPNWFFSHGENYRRSLYADDNLSWLKRRESNRIVYDHFRFLAAWLRSLDADDLFMERVGPPISFGDGVSLQGHPPLDDKQWLPLKDESPFDSKRIQEVLLFETSV